MAIKRNCEQEDHDPSHEELRFANAIKESQETIARKARPERQLPKWALDEINLRENQKGCHITCPEAIKNYYDEVRWMKEAREDYRAWDYLGVIDITRPLKYMIIAGFGYFFTLPIWLKLHNYYQLPIRITAVLFGGTFIAILAIVFSLTKNKISNLPADIVKTSIK